VAKRPIVDKPRFTRVEAAHTLGVSRPTIYLLIARSDLPLARSAPLGASLPKPCDAMSSTPPLRQVCPARPQRPWVPTRARLQSSGPPGDPPPQLHARSPVTPTPRSAYLAVTRFVSSRRDGAQRVGGHPCSSKPRRSGPEQSSRKGVLRFGLRVAGWTGKGPHNSKGACPWLKP
jgi:hypothetical protein